MKVFKELPPSIYNTIRLASIPSSKLQNLKREQLPVIVSLTSIPSRLRTLHIVIRSLITQTHHPKKIILWLNQDLKSRIPGSLHLLQSDLFEICFSELNCPHRKLIHSIEKFPDDVIITCDDDVIYRKDWLRLLYQEHEKYPGKVIGNRTFQIAYDRRGFPLPYQSWKTTDPIQVNKKALVAIGAWGILYPSGSLDSQVLDVELFMRLAPFSDDFWFKAMALINGTYTIQAEKFPKEPIPIIGTQGNSLKKINVKRDLNDAQWSSLSDYFGLDDMVRSKTSKL